MVDPLPSRVVSVGHGPARNLRLCRRGLVDQPGMQDVCELGPPASRVRRNVALVGDSHSAHWRPAFRTLASRLSWRVYSLVSSGCDYASPRQLRFAAPERQAECDAWREKVRAFLVARPEIDTLFLSSLPHPGSREESGYLEAWSLLPASVKRIGVIRDNPHTFPGVDQCLERAVADRRPPGPACALPRAEAVRPDGAFAAAARSSDGRLKAFDFSDFFCRSRCYPVVGGSLVYADGNHQTLRFNSSLSPYLLRALGSAWPGLAARR